MSRKGWRFIVATIVWCCSVQGGAADAPAEWVSWFQDNFEDGTMRRWRVGIDYPAPDASWRLEKDGDNTVMAGHGHIFATATPVTGSDYQFKARVKLIRGWLQMNVRDRCTRYSVRLDANFVSLSRTAPCQQHTQLLTAHEPFGLNRWHVLEIVVLNDEVKVSVNGALKISFKDPAPVMYGGVNFEAMEGSDAQVDDVEVSGPPRTAAGLQIVDYTLPASGLGVAYNHQLTATGGAPPYTWSMAGEPPPAGLTLSEGGEISGKPETHGWQQLAVAVSDSEGRRAIEGLGLEVEQSVITTPSLLPPGRVGESYSAQLAAVGTAEGPQWLMLNVPPGLRLDPVSGVLSGVPALGGAYSPIAVCLAGDDDVLKPMGYYATEANAEPLEFVTQPEDLWDVIVGDGGPSGQLIATGGTPPYRWAVVEGDLPPGMRIIPGNAVPDGNPLAAVAGGLAMSAGRHKFTVEVTDASDLKIQREFEIEASWIEIEADPDDAILAPMGEPVQIQLKARNAIGNVTWSAVSLPAGLELSAGGKLTGALKECGMLPMTLKASDEDKPPAALRFGVSVFGLCSASSYAQLDIHVPSWIVKAKAGEPFELRVGVGNGSGQGYELNVTEGSLPPGLELRRGSLSGAFAVFGTPTDAGAYEAYLRARDSAGTTGQRRFRIAVE